MQRHSDGTVVIAARRFEVPSRYRHLTRIEVRYASWDLSQVHLLMRERPDAVPALSAGQDSERHRDCAAALEPLAGSGEPPTKPSAPGIWRRCSPS